MSDSPDRNKATKPERDKGVRSRKGARVQVDRDLTPEEKKRHDRKVRRENEKRRKAKRGKLKGHAARRAERGGEIV